MPTRITMIPDPAFAGRKRSFQAQTKAEQVIPNKQRQFHRKALGKVT